MDFTLNEEQQMLADLVGRFVEKDYDFDSRRKLAATPQGWSGENWTTIAEMGLLGLNVPEEFGGMGASAAETLIVMEAFGRGLVLEPYVSTAVTGALLLGKAGTQTQKESVLPAIAEGSKRTALATLEPDARFDLNDIATKAARSGNGYVLNGRKAVVLDGPSADWLIVSARTSGDKTDKAGISLFLVDAKTPGVTVKSFPNLDGGRSAEIAFTDVKVGADALIGAEGEGYALLEWTVDRTLVALCAEAVGTMAKLADLTYEYLRTRKQFGKPIGSFQALQHRAADMVSAVEQARSMALYAAARADGGDARELRKAASAAKAIIGRSGRYVGQQAIQMHGGMGMTDELSVGWYVKRLTCIDMTFGNTEHHTELFSEFV